MGSGTMVRSTATAAGVPADGAREVSQFDDGKQQTKQEHRETQPSPGATVRFNDEGASGSEHGTPDGVDFTAMHSQRHPRTSWPYLICSVIPPRTRSPVPL